ncbi:STAS domain-containing protein [Kitasatospora sp. NBC_00240]|uniref:STAS domain-containing protein n=1 Tax=Kitasatospora sp. NBC_00240 TaxID=2903567 RepID=UPI00225712A6|nr:STAS domain-containing protein [Kitasatospora sp. NBC_00240]MCX5215830.1 STAS domain-containing protein [Kitasatospora sp. NBC_00240]
MTIGPPFTATVRDTPIGPVVEAAGELDLAGAPILHTAIHRALASRPASPKLVIDLAAVTFCDSTGIDALLLARTEAGRQGVTLHLAHPTHAVARVLEITGTDRMIPVDRPHRAG